MYLTIKVRNKQIYDIQYIIYYTTTTCYGKYYPNGLDLYLVVCRCRNKLFDSFNRKFVMSLSELKREINV